MTTENLKHWDVLGKTDPNFTKPIEGKRFKGTSINATYCFKKMTEQFGPCGIGWKYEVAGRHIHNAPDGQILLFVDVHLFIQDLKDPNLWSDPIPGVGGNPIFAMEGKGNDKRLFLDDEAYKKATTDALTNAMKFLGMSADIHTGLYDDNKYQAQVREEFGSGKVKDEKKPSELKPNFWTSKKEIDNWANLTHEQRVAALKQSGTNRTDWLGKALKHLPTLTKPEDISRWKTANVNLIANLGQKQKAHLEGVITKRLQETANAPLPTSGEEPDHSAPGESYDPGTGEIEDEIPF